MAIYYEEYPRRFSTVVMDGSNITDLCVILSTFRLFIQGKGKILCCTPLDEDHQTMYVIDAVMPRSTYRELEKELSKYYPGLCMFDPPMVVA